MSEQNPKWRGNPKDKHEADMAVIGKHCIVCGYPVLIPIVRSPVPDWKYHCNHCGAEMLIAVLLNRKAWKY